MTVLIFEDRFAQLVENGEKRQTIRLARKRPIRVGDLLSLRKWSGVAYRSRQVVLLETECVRVATIRIDAQSADIGAHEVTDLDSFAMADGFGNWGALVEWFRAAHKLPFHGILIAWSGDMSDSVRLPEHRWVETGLNVWNLQGEHGRFYGCVYEAHGTFIWHTGNGQPYYQGECATRNEAMNYVCDHRLRTLNHGAER